MTMGFFRQLILELINDGNIVDIATNETISKVPSFFKDIGCKIFQISTSRSPLNIGNFRAVKQIRTIAKDYDIIHCHTPIAGLITRLGCKKLRRQQRLKIIYTAHGFHFYKGAPKKSWLLYFPIEKICSKWTDVLITINNEDYEFAKKTMKAKRIEYIHGVGIDFAKISSRIVDKKSIREMLDIPLDANLIISVGELNKNKNHQIVIKALSIVNNSNIHYIIAGVGNEREKLKKLAQKMKVNLHLLGHRDDIIDLYKSSDICAFPSIREGLGLAALEGMACGLPLVCSNNRGTREYAFDGAIKCRYNSAEDFAIGISKLLDKNASAKMGNYNRLFASRFDIRRINSLMMKIYLEIME